MLASAPGPAPAHDLNTPTASPPREYRFQFTGKGSEYFSIWIVNLLLSIITLGIYSAWAKVRREQYFHRNTLLDDHPFDYTGDPQKILKGRVVALIVLAIGATLQEVNVALALGVVVAYAFLYPWVIVRGLKFRARNTRYRNIALAFTGTTQEAFKVFCWIYLALLPVVVVLVYFGPEIAAINAQEGADLEPDMAAGPMLWLMLALSMTALLFVVLWPTYLARQQSFIHRHLRYGNAQGGFDGRTRDFFAALLKVSGVSILAFFAMGAVIAAAVALEMFFLFFFVYVLLLLPSAAYKTFVVNTTYRHSSIGAQRMHSDMKVGGYTLLLLTNLLLMVVTLGLAWPWVKVRLARYRCEHLALFAAPAVFENIIGEAQQNPSAIGEEVADFLDFDISL